jgi:hypothetical protein
VKRWPAFAAVLVLPLLAATAAAATAYVSDELVLGVYAEQDGQGQRLTTLHSGADVDTLAVNGEFTQVRLSDGTVGWVKSTYLTTRKPATTRVKELEEELDRSHATTPALAEAAARSELERLKRDLTAMQSELNAARASANTSVASDESAGGASKSSTAGLHSAGSSADPANSPGVQSGTGSGISTAVLGAGTASSPAAMRRDATGSSRAWVSSRLAALAALVSLALGFWLGYATLARRVRQKFGGIKVY